VELINSPEGEERRQLLARKIEMLRHQLPPAPGSAGPPNSSSAIFPWMVGDEQAAMDLSRALINDGFLVPAIRYPTVAKGAARLRITLTVSHGEAQIEMLCGALRRLPTSK
jgi:7-keto-8-aminopelargonate synthetase-like enzyme